MKVKTLFLICGVLFFILGFNKESLASQYAFNGYIDFVNNKLEVSLLLPNTIETDSLTNEPSALVGEVSKVNDNEYKLHLTIRHLKALHYNLSTEFNSSIGIQNLDDGIGRFVAGKLSTQYSLLDLKPINELKGDFLIRDGKLSLNGISYGNVTCNGTVELHAPFNVNLSFGFDRLDMPDFLRFWIGTDEYLSSGIVSGDIKATGSLEKIFLKGNISSFNGNVDKLAFDTFLLNAEGYFPQIQIARSKVVQPDGLTYSIDGPINLRDTEHFKSQVKSLVISPIVSTTQDQSAWTIRRYKETGSSSTEVKYFLRNNPLDKAKDAPDSDMLGVQRTLEF